MNRNQLASGVVVTAAMLSQLFAAWWLFDPLAPTWRVNTGWVLTLLSSVFGWLPIFTLRKKGDIDGRSYVHTTSLVTSGVYGIIRHPQYLAGILLCLGLMLITTHWLVVLPGLIGILAFYTSSFAEEAKNLEKFGDRYQEYQQGVPRFNFLLGFFRAIKR